MGSLDGLDEPSEICFRISTNEAASPCIVLEPDRRSDEVQSFEAELRKRIIGQDQAIDSLVATFQSVRAGLAPERRPIRNFSIPRTHGFWQDPVCRGGCRGIVRKTQCRQVMQD